MSGGLPPGGSFAPLGFLTVDRVHEARRARASANLRASRLYHNYTFGYMPMERAGHGWVGGPPSAQELAILALVVEGLKSSVIGKRLGVTEGTVKKHVTSLLRKFDAENRAQLAAKAIAWGIVRVRGDESADAG